MYARYNNTRILCIFILGSGKAHSWNDLVRALFTVMGRQPQIQYVAMPESLQESYQYFTHASMERLKKSGCPLHFRSLEDAVRDYVVGE